MIKCVCIDDKNKPSVIPSSHWVKEGQQYHVTYVYKLLEPETDRVLGLAFDLKELDLRTVNSTYVNFRSERFVFDAKDLDKLLELAKECAEMDGIDISWLVETKELVEE